MKKKQPSSVHKRYQNQSLRRITVYNSGRGNNSKISLLKSYNNIHPSLRSNLQMQKGNRKHAWLYVIVIILIAVMLVSFYYQFGYLPQKQSRTSFQEPVGPIWGQSGTSSQGTFGSTVRPNIVGGPDIFATLSFSNATGFVTTLHPTSGTTEFVMLPNITGEFTVSYMSSNNLTVLFFTDQDPVLKVDLSNGTLGTGSGLRVT